MHEPLVLEPMAAGMAGLALTIAITAVFSRRPAFERLLMVALAIISGIAACVMAMSPRWPH